ncbi:MAG: thioredoxin-dependent thiol peroxidase [Candidatus Kapaibacteriales bacterium]
MRLESGDKAPDFMMVTGEGTSKVASEDLKGKRYVIYFYPKDDTPGCTTEACDFRDNMERLTSSEVKVIGVSPDTLASHDKFKDKYDLNFELASDPEHEIAEKFGAWGEKNMYGKKSMGIIRSTFLISPDQKIEKAWYNVRAKGHVDKVLSEIEK